MRAKIVTPARPAIQTKEELESAAGDVSGLLLELSRVKAEMDAKLLTVREEYEAYISRLNSAIEPRLEDIRNWAERNRLSAFAERRSLELLHATIGFRTGQQKLALLKGMKWAAVLDMLKIRLGGRYVRTKTEPDKERLLADREILGKDKLRELGLEVVQDEAFLLEPRRDDLPPVEGTR